MADEKKEIKITNWQVPRSPEMQKFDAYKKAPAIDLNSDKYRDTGKIHHGDLQHAIDRTIAKQEAAIGMPIDQESQPETVNLKGINDERPKEFWTPPRIGKR